VVPGSATQEQWDKVAHDAKVHGRTVTGSYDDAGIGCGLASRTAVLFGIAAEDQQMFVDWYAEHYTGSKVEFRALPVLTPIPQLNMRKPLQLGASHKVTQRFGDNYDIYMQRYGIPGHNGIDWATNMGEPVFAAYDGSILATGYDENGYGLFITVQHEQGVVTTYAHLLDISIYELGEDVKKGNQIGETGNSGWSSGPHLHFGVEVNGQAVNPESFLGPQE
jgi:murein DD-endopeptidase MepM/ murein hydrolase activator NlpD